MKLVIVGILAIILVLGVTIFFLFGSMTKPLPKLETGKLVMFVKDTPIAFEDYYLTRLPITFDSLQIRSSDGIWIDLTERLLISPFSNLTTSVSLPDLVENPVVLFKESNMTATTYDQIKFHLAGFPVITIGSTNKGTIKKFADLLEVEPGYEVNIPFNQDLNLYELTLELSIPNPNIVINGKFEVFPGKETKLTLDFDASKSLKQVDASFEFQPVINVEIG